MVRRVLIGSLKRSLVTILEALGSTLLEFGDWLTSLPPLTLVTVLKLAFGQILGLVTPPQGTVL